MKSGCRLFRFWFPRAASAVLALAASTPALARPPVQPGEGETLVYLYRAPVAVGAARAASFYIDGRKVIDLASNGCAVAVLPAGHHRLQQVWRKRAVLDYGSNIDSPDKITSLEDDWAAGQTYFYRLDAGAREEERGIFVFEWWISRTRSIPDGRALGTCRIVRAADFQTADPDVHLDAALAHGR